MKREYEHGYIAILSTLIVGAVALTVATAVLLLGISSRQSTLVAQQAVQARKSVDGCAEEALMQIQANTSFTGTNTGTFSGVSCSYTVANTGSATRTISATTTSGNVVRKVIVYVTINASSISITSWQEVI